MRGGFTKGVIVGSLVGASVSMLLETDGMKKKRKKMMKQGRKMVRSSSEVIGDLVALLM